MVLSSTFPRRHNDTSIGSGWPNEREMRRNQQMREQRARIALLRDKRAALLVEISKAMDELTAIEQAP